MRYALLLALCGCASPFAPADWDRRCRRVSWWEYKDSSVVITAQILDCTMVRRRGTGAA